MNITKSIFDLNFKHENMNDGDKQKNLEKNVSGQSLPNIFNAGFVFQSIWIRCRSIFPNITDRKFMESELRLVLYCGTFLWIIYLLSQII
jgi:hypothetical protein